MKSNFLNGLFVVVLIVLVGIILYNVIQESVIEPVENFNREIHNTIDRAFNSIE